MKLMQPMNDRGHALVTAVVTLTILVTIGTGLLTLTATEKKISVNSAKSAKAFYLAEGGLNYAIANLSNNRSWRVTSQTINIGEGSFTLKVENGSSPESVKATSKGTVGNVTRTVVAEVSVPAAAAIFTKAITAYGSTGQNIIEQQAKINGDILSNQSINISQNPEINGSVISNGEITGFGAGDIENKTENAGVTIPEPVEPTYPQKALPSWEENWYLTEGLGDPVVINGKVSNVSAFNNGSYFRVTGDVTLGKNTQLTGKTIVADGLISIGDDSTLTQVTLKAGSTLTLGNNNSLNDVTLVADSTLAVDGDAEFSGTLYSGGNMTVQQKLKTTGDSVLYAGGTLTLGQTADFKGFFGQIYSSGNMSINQQLRSQGSLVIISGGSLTADQDLNLNIAEIYSTGSMSIEQKLKAENMLISVEGNLSLGQNAEISGEVYTRGTLNINQNLKGEDTLALVAGGDINLGQDAEFGGIIYSHRGKLVAEQKFKFTGSIFVSAFLLEQQCELIFDEGIAGTPVSGIGGGGSISLITWTEQ
ncbi:hypothetical protein SY88_11435 [Clostridiales bacterium PH28_bin88]|nr:hypothetical protein SY88_11435 [Clostridiales bacterium PH28_bin88]